jgi:leucyl/phenylalanyl-tRNA--protein transferase
MRLFGPDDPFPAIRPWTPQVVGYSRVVTRERLLEAYGLGIFPWPDNSDLIPWVSPHLRMVLPVPQFRPGRTLRKRLRRDSWRVTMDQAFDRVIAACAEVPREGQAGTWITGMMREAYADLHRIGHAHSVEVWEGDTLVGGLYGVSVGRLFCGESMFHLRPDASKVAFATLVRQFQRWRVPLVDCQVYTNHLESLGAQQVRRDAYLSWVPGLVAGTPTLTGPWACDVVPADWQRPAEPWVMALWAELEAGSEG